MLKNEHHSFAKIFVSLVLVYGKSILLIFGIAGVNDIDGGNGGTLGFSFLVILTVGDCFNKLFINMFAFGFLLLLLIVIDFSR